jgi:hypothetical protein
MYKMQPCNRATFLRGPQADHTAVRAKLSGVKIRLPAARATNHLGRKGSNAKYFIANNDHMTVTLPVFFINTVF